MLYRKLDDDGDYSFGHGSANFWKDVPEAPAQAVMTRLHLNVGEWFLDTREGMAWKTRVLDKRTADTRDPTIRARVLGTEGVTRITAYSSDLDRDTRAFTVSATIDTEYGSTTIEEPL